MNESYEIETELQLAIQHDLKRLGFWVERTNAGQTGGVRHLSKGTPDLLIVAPCYGWIEVKLPGAELNPNQRRWHRRAHRAGVPVIVAESRAAAREQAISWRAQQPLR